MENMSYGLLLFLIATRFSLSKDKSLKTTGINFSVSIVLTKGKLIFLGHGLLLDHVTASAYFAAQPAHVYFDKCTVIAFIWKNTREVLWNGVLDNKIILSSKKNFSWTFDVSNNDYSSLNRKRVIVWGGENVKYLLKKTECLKKG